MFWDLVTGSWIDITLKVCGKMLGITLRFAPVYDNGVVDLVHCFSIIHMEIDFLDDYSVDELRT